jgi:cytochrome c
MSLRLLMALTSILAMAAPARAQNAGNEQGQIAFNNACRTCHSIKEGDNRLGPSLHGIVGKKAGTTAGYNNYSSAMKDAGLTWDERTLDRFIASPDEMVRGNNMKPYGGQARPTNAPASSPISRRQTEAFATVPERRPRSGLPADFEARCQVDGTPG